MAQNVRLAPTATAHKASAASAVMVTAHKANAAHAAMATVRKASVVHAPMATAHKANAARALMVTVHKVVLAPTVTTHRAQTDCSATITTPYNKNGCCSSKKRCVVRVGNPKSTELAPVNASMAGIISTLELSTVVKAPVLLARRRAEKPSHPGASRRRKSKTPNKSVQDNTDPLWHSRSNTTIAVNRD